MTELAHKVSLFSRGIGLVFRDVPGPVAKLVGNATAFSALQHKPHKTQAEAKRLAYAIDVRAQMAAAKLTCLGKPTNNNRLSRTAITNNFLNQVLTHNHKTDSSLILGYCLKDDFSWKLCVVGSWGAFDPEDPDGQYSFHTDRRVGSTAPAPGSEKELDRLARLGKIAEIDLICARKGPKGAASAMLLYCLGAMSKSKKSRMRRYQGVIMQRAIAEDDVTIPIKRISERYGFTQIVVDQEGSDGNTVKDWVLVNDTPTRHWETLIMSKFNLGVVGTLCPTVPRTGKTYCK